MRLPTLGAKYQTNFIQVKNGETSAAINSGQPVCFAFNGTDDGLAVVLPATAAASKASSFFAGVLQVPGSASLAAGGIGDAQIFGMVTNAKITLATRATSTDSFASYASAAIGFALNLDTVGNGFTTSNTVAALTGLAYAILGQSIASSASTVSTSANTATSATASVKVFIRAM